MSRQFISSIRSRLMAASLAMILPLVILAVISYFAFERIMASFDEVLSESLNELQPIAKLEYDILSTTIPLHGYLIHGSLDELERFRVIAAEVDRHFIKVRKIKSLGQEQRVIVKDAEKGWKENRKLADKIMSYRPPFSPESTVMMELFDLRLTKLNERLRVIREHVDRDIIALNHSAEKRHIKSSRLNMLIIIISTLVAISIGLLLGRSIVRQLDELERAAREFSNGNMSYRISVFSDDEVGRLSQTFNTMAQKIEDLVIHDPLTGLLNRREFERRLAHEISRADRYTNPLSLLLIDIDHFKKVNDKFGHQVGDMVLAWISTAIVSQTRNVDHVARYGGEELAIILPEVAKQVALHKANVIREFVQSETFQYADKDSLRVTISIGVATFSDDAEDATGLVAAADAALYHAKHQGRNRVEAYSPA